MPILASEVVKDMIAMLKGQICRIVDVGSLKPGRKKCKHIIGLALKGGRRWETEIRVNKYVDVPTQEQLDECLELP